MSGGAVSVITNAPTKQFDAGIIASYGRYNAVHADGFVSGPLTDTLSARLAATVDQGGAWQYHRDTLEELGDKDRWAVRLRLDWQPTEATQIDGSLRYNRDQSDGLGLRLVTRPFQSHNYAPIGRLYPIDTERRITGWGISPYFAKLIGVSPSAVRPASVRAPSASERNRTPERVTPPSARAMPPVSRKLCSPSIVTDTTMPYASGRAYGARRVGPRKRYVTSRIESCPSMSISTRASPMPKPPCGGTP